MVREGNFLIKIIYYNHIKSWLVKDITKGKEFHTHVRYKKAAEMIATRANKGVIPKHYPSWMVESINRLWFGKYYTDRIDLNNEDLYTNNPAIRVKVKEGRHGSKRSLRKTKPGRR